MAAQFYCKTNVRANSLRFDDLAALEYNVRNPRETLMRTLCKYWWIELPAILLLAGGIYGGYKLWDSFSSAPGDEPQAGGKPSSSQPADEPQAGGKPSEVSLPAISTKEVVGKFGVRGFPNEFTDRRLIIGDICYGSNFQVKSEDRGNRVKDLSRLATTYYHREGPIGRVMEKFNWFPGEMNEYQADTRL